MNMRKMLLKAIIIAGVVLISNDAFAHAKLVASSPAANAAVLTTSVLSTPPTQIGNRQLLREAMYQGGFKGINSEWWHFDCGDRDVVRAEYTRIL